MTYTIRIPKEIETRLSFLSEQTGRTKSFYIKEALLEYIADLEDVYIAEKRLEDIRAGRTKTVSLQEVMKEHGMDC
ncbi:MAG: DUF6290 family protein [Myxococcaceae bacterium]|jgi:RHH-type rel operon transcriptional repressor/antitoxin RelB